MTKHTTETGKQRRGNPGTPRKPYKTLKRPTVTISIRVYEDCAEAIKTRVMAIKEKYNK